MVLPSYVVPLGVVFTLFLVSPSQRARGADPVPLDVEWSMSPLLSDCEGPCQDGSCWYDSDFDAGSWESPFFLPYIEGVSTMADRFFRGYFELDFVDTTTFSFSSDDGIDVFVNSEYLGSWGPGCHAPGCVNLQPCGIMDEVPPVDITAYLRPGGNVIGVHLTNCECCCNMHFGGEVTFGEGEGEPTESSFRRSDSDQDGRASLTDAVKTLNCLFIGQPCSPCLDAEDSNDDGGLDLTDAVFTLNYLFIGGAEPPPPVVDCGPDPSEDSLLCDDYPLCP